MLGCTERCDADCRALPLRDNGHIAAVRGDEAGAAALDGSCGAIARIGPRCAHPLRLIAVRYEHAVVRRVRGAREPRRRLWRRPSFAQPLRGTRTLAKGDDIAAHIRHPSAGDDEQSVGTSGDGRVGHFGHLNLCANE